MYNTMDIKDGQELIIDNNRFDMHRFKLGEKVYVKFVIGFYLLRVENEYGTEYDVHISNVKLSEENDKMNSLIGKMVRVNSRIKDSYGSEKYFEKGYKIDGIYEVIGQQSEHNSVQLKNPIGLKDYWFSISHLTVIDNETELEIVKASVVLKNRKDEIYRKIKDLQKESELVDEALNALEKLPKGK